MKKIKIFAIFLLGFVIMGSGVVWAMPPHPDWDSAVKSGALIVPDHNLVPKDAPNGVDFSKIQKSTQGVRNFKTLVLLVDFPDKPAQVSPAFFDNLVFGISNSNTVREFYRSNSYGQLDLMTLNMPSSIGWKRAPQNYSYYVGGEYDFGFGPYPNNVQKLAEDLVDLADPFVNFADYDNDGDGFVDGVIIVHAGRGAEIPPQGYDIWSQRSFISPRTKDGVLISSFSIQPEYWNSATVLKPGNVYPGDMTIGVYAHETGHLFGLPDLYDTDSSSRGVGDWSVMAGGSWNGPAKLGESPANFDAWSKSEARLGFLNSQLIQGAGAIQLPAAANSPTVFRINSVNAPATEYFLIENRQKTGYDTALPGSGLMIWHVDESKSNNTKEWYPGHTTTGNYKVALEQADGLWELEKGISSGAGGDPFPSSTGKTVLNNTTVPDLKSYSGVNSEFGISDISVLGINMTAYITSLNISPPAICGDLNGDGIINISDVTLVIDYAFRGVPVPLGVNADLNASGAVDIFDVLELINHTFRNYSPPDCLNTPPAAVPTATTPLTFQGTIAPSSGAVGGFGTNLKVGATVQTTDYLKVRAKPFGLVITTVPPNIRGEVLEGPSTLQGYRWWKVKYSNGVQGWSAENWIGAVSGANYPTQSGQSN